MLLDFAFLITIIEQGLIFSLIVCGVYLTSRIIKFDDLSIEGSFALGAAVMARSMMLELPLCTSFPLAIIAGGLAGCATGLLHTRLQLNNLISGIVVTTGLFSINLKTAGSNLALAGKHTLFDYIPFALEHHIIVLAPLVIGIISTIAWFLTTEVGFLLRATGDNPQVLTNTGKNKDHFKILALALSNSMTALAGALFVQHVGYFSIWASVGILIISLAGLIIGENISNNLIIKCISGALFYQALIAITFECNIDQDWNKLITAVLIIILLIIKKR